jgi:hypothetical protein
MELTMPPEPKDVFVSEGVLHVGPMRRAYFPRMLSPEHFLSMRGVLSYPRGVLGGGFLQDGDRIV